MLVATLPVYLNALSKHGVHVVTVNDYLSDGTKVARTDTFGAWVCYRCSNTFGLWSQLVSHSSMPPAYFRRYVRAKSQFDRLLRRLRDRYCTQ